MQNPMTKPIKITVGEHAGYTRIEVDGQDLTQLLAITNARLELPPVGYPCLHLEIIATSLEVIALAASVQTELWHPTDTPTEPTEPTGTPLEQG